MQYRSDVDIYKPIFPDSAIPLRLTILSQIGDFFAELVSSSLLVAEGDMAIYFIGTLQYWIASLQSQ
jgi:hypothetical protein